MNSNNANHKISDSEGSDDVTVVVLGSDTAWTCSRYKHFRET